MSAATPAARENHLIALPRAGRVPPHNLDAERSLLGGVLLDSQAFADVLEVVKAEDFYREGHRKVFEAMTRLALLGEPIDRVTVKSELTAMGALEAIGGEEFVDLLDKITPVAANLTFYAKEIRNKARARRMIETAQSIAHLGYEQHGSADDYLAEARKRFDALAGESRQHETAFVTVGDFIASCADSIEYVCERFVPRGGFVFVIAAPKGGKTFFCGWLAADTAAKGMPVLFVEEEGTREVLRQRLTPFLGSDPSLYPKNLHIAWREGFRLDNAADVNRLIAAVKAKGAALLILDPLVQLHSGDENEQSSMRAVVQAVQHIISETGCAVVLVHHTRKGDSWVKSSTAEAQSADARGSGVFVGAADTIISLKAVPQNERRPGEVRFYVENPDSRMGEPFGRLMAVVDLAGGPLMFLAPDAQNSAEIARLLPFIPYEPEVITVDDLRDAAGGSAEKVRSAIKQGVGDGIVSRRSGKTGGVYRVKNGRLVGDSRRESEPITDRRLDSIGESAMGTTP